MKRVLSNHEAVSAMASDMIVALARQRINEKGGFSVALSGGNTPLRMFEMLAERKSGIDWEKVEVFWADERCVPPEDKLSNFGAAYERLLRFVKARMHRIKGELGADEAARLYEVELHAYKNELQNGKTRLKEAAMDMIVLGVGADGHTASLFPGSRALSEKKRMAVPVYDINLPRVTMTLNAINRASDVLFLATGRDKAAIAGKLFGAPDKDSQGLPAGLVRPVGSLTWLLDKEAAALIQG